MRRHATIPRPEYGRGFVMDAPIPGTILAERYRVERILGQGGMGIVVAARHLHLDQCVAIKLLQPNLVGEASFVARFIREARAAAKIRSEHVGRVFDVGLLAGGAPYIVMEYLDGCDLAALIGAEGPLEVGTAVDYVLQACEAISEAHVLGIVHRDLKPENLFLTRRADGSPCVKVLDFGISKQTGAARSELAQTAFLLGSPMYMSPEQLECSSDVDARADVWGLGVVLFELLTARQPFVADSLAQLVAAIMHAAAPPARAFAPSVPEGLDAVLARCLEKDPARRFPDIGELAAELARFRAPAPWAPPMRAVTPAEIAHTTPLPIASRPRRSRRRAAIVAGLVALCAAGGAYLDRRESPPDAPVAPAPAPSEPTAAPAPAETAEVAPIAPPPPPATHAPAIAPRPPRVTAPAPAPSSAAPPAPSASAAAPALPDDRK